jgi:hypothetical protein
MMQNYNRQFCCLEFPWTREGVSAKTIDNLGNHSQKCSPAVVDNNARMLLAGPAVIAGVRQSN